MRTKSSTNHIRALLREGYAYSEIHEITGYSKTEICRQANVLEHLGVKFRKRTDAEMKRYLLNTMPKGNLGQIIGDLSLIEVQCLMDKSMVSWADAIRVIVRESSHGKQNLSRDAKPQKDKIND